MRVFLADAIFGESDEVDFVIAAEALQQMKGAMVGAAVERIWNVRINSENFHSVKSIPDFSVGGDEAGESCFTRDEIALQFGEVRERVGRPE